MLILYPLKATGKNVGIFLFCVYFLLGGECVYYVNIFKNKDVFFLKASQLKYKSLVSSYPK